MLVHRMCIFYCKPLFSQKYRRNIFLAGILLICGTGSGQVISEGTALLCNEPVISGLHTLSIHVLDTMTHDSVYRFLKDKLSLPVYYTPERYGQRKYAGLYAGNMVLEPCGPYPEIEYATDSFRAVFYGMNFEVYRSLQQCRRILADLHMVFQDNQNSLYLRDSILCSDNLFSALYEVRDRNKRDSLRNILSSNRLNPSGIVYISEIQIGYREDATLQRWKEFLYPLRSGGENICQVNDSLQIKFSKDSINQVKAVTFRVGSLASTIRYLDEIGLPYSALPDRIKLEPLHAFGLTIYFTE